MALLRRAISVVGFGFLLFAVGCGSAERLEADELKGDKLFVLKDLEGREWSLESTLKEKKAVLINFWATWCTPCREEIPDLIRLQKEYEDRGFVILGVDAGESTERVKSFVKKTGINYPVLLDSDKSVTAEYGIDRIPTSLLVAPDGKIVGKYNVATPQLFADVEKAVSA